MRFALLALALAACSSAEPVTPDASTSPDVFTVDVSADTAAPDVTPDVSADASAEASVDAAPDVASDAGVDAPVDAAADARSCGSSITFECLVDGHLQCVDVQRGRVVGDHIEHCGACGVICAAGQVCLEMRCQNL